ncbi:MAG: sulfotransferase [Thermodesulfobacteriota bacterium]|nr:sulfotransferase [Thermodesulfobacteriota bacterium]
MSSLFGKNLLFVISQPRAGSTLLQRMLGSHPDIHTVSEPWLMLYPLYGLRSRGQWAEYNWEKASAAMQGFVSHLPRGADDYSEGMRRMYGYLYHRVLAGSGKRYFLDKTPRYYLIISELYRTFPEARYIVLLRNPLAVLCSIIRTWIKENCLGFAQYFQLYEYRHDLVRAPGLLLEGAEILGERCIVVRYEELVRDPQGQIRRICDELGVSFAPRMLEYGGADHCRWTLGDQEHVYKFKGPCEERLASWERDVDDPQIWRFANEYLEILGQKTLEHMGYSYGELRRILEDHRPYRILSCLTFSLTWLLGKPLRERRRWEVNLLRLIRSIQKNGIIGTLSAGLVTLFRLHER